MVRAKKRPQQGYIAWRNWPPTCRRRLPLLFPLLSFSYSISLSLDFPLFPSFSLWGSLAAPPLSGNDVAPRNRHVTTVPFSSRVQRGTGAEKRSRESVGIITCVPCGDFARTTPLLTYTAHAVHGLDKNIVSSQRCGSNSTTAFGVYC